MSISVITKVAQRQNDITEFDQSGFEPESVECANGVPQN